MTIEIGDTVHTASGKLYIVRSFFDAIGYTDRQAYLQPLKPRPSRHSTHAAVGSLTLVRSRELSLAFHYAALSELDGAQDWQRARDRQMAARWLSRAEERNDDSRAALCLGSDRILELEAAS